MNTPGPISERNFYEISSTNTIQISSDPDLQQAFYDFSEKFRFTATYITENILEEHNIAHLDMFFFPIAYFYRHSLELILKAIAFKCIPDKVHRQALVEDAHHNLSILLDRISPYVTTQLSNDPEAHWWLKQYFRSISAIDKASDSFRYPYAIKAETHIDSLGGRIKRYHIESIISEQTHINLTTFSCKMEIAFILLNALYKKDFGRFKDFRAFKPTVLEEGGNYYNQSVIGYSYNKAKYHPFVYAYLQTAEQIYSEIKNDNSIFKDKLFLPMCYLYRNGIELSLKETLFEECSYEPQDALKHIKSKKHNILGLWKLIKDEIEEHAEASDDDTTIENVEKYIQQLHTFDGSSSIFRYPADKHLNLPFKNTKKLDIDNVNAFFFELSSFLGAVNSMMNSQNEIMKDIKSDYYSELKSYNDYYYE